MTYTAPVDDIRFVLETLCDLDALFSLPGVAEAGPDVIRQILDEAGAVAAEVLAPLNQSGDREGSVLENGVVRTPKGFKEAYQVYQEGGWNGLGLTSDYGGMGLPNTLAMALQEFWQGANMGFALCPILTQGAALAVDRHGSERQKSDYLAKLISGEWAAAMVMTESHAGSDLGALTTKAVRDGDHYRITGQKIFISYGDHDLTDNIVHLVLARTPDAPAGSKGLSLFLVPKYPVQADGSLGPANDMKPVMLEAKLGIHAAPTATMSYGDNGGAVGTLIGEVGDGMTCMFTMMNIVRIGVGIQGLAIAERAYQAALEYARTRIQSPLAGRPKDGSVAIIKHPDVRRMLMTMRAQVEAMRALALTTVAAGDFADRLEDSKARAHHAARLALLTPVVKAWCSDLGVEIASLGVQVHGGAGYIEETGAAQHLRDARIAPIYEGTNGIQALDLMVRKVLRDGGASIGTLIDEMRDTVRIDLPTSLGAAANGDGNALASFELMRDLLGGGIDDLQATVSWILDCDEGEHDFLAANAVAFLHLLGTIVGGWLLFKSAVAARSGASGPEFAVAKTATASFYMANILPRTRAFGAQVTGGGASVMALDEGLF
ncbi:MAG: acyl-CoA dehydrogenase [Alphaproteobacteria bacterium]|nr:acyl-CoA dehydrogenase [Alphaproteobacteria bacterium]